MGKLPEPASDFLRAEDVDDGDVVTILAHPETIPAEQTKYGRERHVIDIELPDKNQKRWGLNLTSYRALYKAFGDEGQDWIAKKVKVVKNREKVRGETRHVLYAEPYKEAQQIIQPQAEATHPAQSPTAAVQETKQWLTPEFYNMPKEDQKRILKKLSMQQ